MRWLIAGLAILSALPAVADDGLLVVATPDGKIIQKVADPEVAGDKLAGLRLGRVHGAFDPSDLRLFPAIAGNGRAICLQIRSRDGIYSSITPFRMDPPNAAALRLADPTQFIAAVRAYPEEDVAIRAIVSDDCSEASEGPLVPATFGRQPPDPVLTLLLNTREKDIGIALGSRSGVIAKSDGCRSVVGSRTIFGVVCDLDLPADLAAGTYDLEVTITPITGRKALSTYEVILAGGG